MTTATTRVKSRRARYQHLADNLGTLDLSITRGEQSETFNYFVEDLGIDCDDRDGGEAVRAFRCFRLTKSRHQQKPDELASYDVRIATDAVDASGGHSCECMGFLRWGRSCKHISSLFALIRNGKL